MYTIKYNTLEDARQFKHWIRYYLGIDVRIREEPTRGRDRSTPTAPTPPATLFKPQPQQTIKVMKELLRDLDSDGDFSGAELQEIRRLATAIEDKVIEIAKD